jgi:hypothetical protein
MINIFWTKFKNYKQFLYNAIVIIIAFSLYGCCSCTPEYKTVVQKSTDLKTAIYFGKDSSRIRTADLMKLSEISLWMARTHGAHLVITGYSSNKNKLALAKRRAKNVKAALVNFYGIRASRIQIDQRNSVGNNLKPKFKSNSDARCAIISVKVSAPEWEYADFVTVGSESNDGQAEYEKYSSEDT